MCRSGKASTETDPRLLTCGDAGEVLLYSPNSIPGAPPLQRLRGHHAGAYCSTWLSAKSCATGGFDRRAFLWDLRQQKPRAAMQTRQHVYSMAAVENDLFVGLGEGCIAQWDLRFGPPVRELRGHGAAVEALAVVPGALASAGSDGVLRLWSRQGEPTWHFSTRGALTCMSTVAEDSLLVGGHGLPPTALSLDYDKAIMHVPKALKQMNLPSMRPFQPGGYGRHTDLRRRRRATLAKTSESCEDGFYPEERGTFDRSTKQKAVPLGATGASHRAFLCGLRR
ncbi:Telomerase protein component 1 (Telomerase-associated protein 1) (Telomerase protein 1) (p240) (p80 telomerase homolog) [Durusdinium trenchii]|uniref:Telomerase protein component 1 (Telomerase-associated protein 1) (Telomerase protein 1) (p240) (p80 telomerase homolog) n=1 Tax=Durusdinium trenchii TaxID=1381693 RepID=A0ABP0KDN3_9DINO